MSSGYVLHFSDRTFGEFMEETCGVDIHSEHYRGGGSSKANKLRTFWRLEGDHQVGRCLTAMIEMCVPGETAEAQTLLETCRAIAARLLHKTGRTTGSSLMTDPTEAQVSQYRITVTAGQFIDRVFTQDDDGVTAKFGAIKTMGPEVVKAGTGLFSSGERKGAVFEVRNLVPAGGGERFAPGSWVTLADYYIALLQTLNARAPATQGALSTTDLGVVDPGRVQVQHAGADALAGMGSDTNADVLNVIRRLRPTQTRVTQATV